MVFEKIFYSSFRVRPFSAEVVQTFVIVNARRGISSLRSSFAISGKFILLLRISLKYLQLSVLNIIRSMAISKIFVHIWIYFGDSFSKKSTLNNFWLLCSKSLKRVKNCSYIYLLCHQVHLYNHFIQFYMLGKQFIRFKKQQKELKRIKAFLFSVAK